MGRIDTETSVVAVLLNVMWLANLVHIPLSRGNGRSVRPSSTELFPLCGSSAADWLLRAAQRTSIDHLLQVATAPSVCCDLLFDDPRDLPGEERRIRRCCVGTACLSSPREEDQPSCSLLSRRP